MKCAIPVRVLVLDDDAAAAARLAEWLRTDGYDVVSFTRAVEVLAHAARAPSAVALVALRLADVDGNEVIRQLHALQPDLRIIALTAFPQIEQVLTAMRAGARDLLEKPIQPPRLKAALDAQLAELGLALRTEEDFNRRLGARLRELRTATERTLADVADTSGLTAAQLSQIELGKSGTSAWSLARIAAALGMPLSRLLAEL